jgi:nucleotide-binding universal stress UspA family protein
MTMNILLAVDGSAYTKKMLAYLATHSELLGSSHEYTVVTVQTPLPARARAALGKAVVDGYYAEEAEKVLAPVCKFLKRHGVDAKRVVKVGAAGESIAKVADGGPFELLVMGSHGHGALATLVMGSVTTQVLAHCKVPVLIVR